MVLCCIRFFVYVTTVYNGMIKYLKIVNNYIYLADTPDSDCILNVTLGTGDYAGKIRISNLKDHAPYFQSVNNGFSGNTTQNNQRPWFYLVEKSNISLDDFVIYSADKIDVSDIENGDKIVMYLRKWDEKNSDLL